MPIFEYQCPACGFVNEVLVKSAAAKAPACPQCGEKKVHKRMSGFAAVTPEAAAPPTACRQCPGAAGCPNANR